MSAASFGTLVRIARSPGITPDVLLRVAAAPARNRRRATIDRVAATMGNLPDEVIGLIAIQIEALGAAKGKPR